MDLILVVPEKDDAERDQLARVWYECGGEVSRLGRFWDPPPYERERVRVYGSVAFCQVLALKLDLSLVTPADDLILTLPAEARKRMMWSARLGDAEKITYPCFIKPMVPKLFQAAVYDSARSLAAVCVGLADDTLLLCSEPITLISEVRAFILDGKILDLAVYEGEADIKQARRYLEALIETAVLPRTVVLDVGHMGARGWCVIEANAVWGAGLNGCAADKVWPAIAAATCPA